MNLKGWSDEQIKSAIEAQACKEPFISGVILVFFAPAWVLVLLERAFSRSHGVEVVVWCIGAAICVAAYFTHKRATEKRKFWQELVAEWHSRSGS